MGSNSTLRGFAIRNLIVCFLKYLKSISFSVVFTNTLIKQFTGIPYLMP